MIVLFILIYFHSVNIEGRHFNGGTIRWEPIGVYNNSTVVSINIIQSYSWAYPLISCATNVPISSSGYSGSNANLICMSECSTDGGYSSKPVNILTDCQSTSSELGLMTSQRTVSINLTANAHFYLSYVGSAWAPLSSSSAGSLQWSITTYIDLRLRPDGVINKPPTASVVSPQYATVNQTIQITIPVSDVNAGDDVRCRWSTYIAGYRRRRSDEGEPIYHSYQSSTTKKSFLIQDLVHERKRRKANPCKGAACTSSCGKGCSCTACSSCAGTTCNAKTCNDPTVCPAVSTTTETPGTIKPTSSYATRQAIDECGGICYPSAIPNTTTLSGCTISFIGRVSGAWYAVAIQVEDFINSTSVTPMSSVPVQMLIYVMDAPTCNSTPVVLPLSRCFDVQVGVTVTFNISAFLLCDPNISVITDIIISTGISGMNVSDTTASITNASIAYNTFIWTPSSTQLGSQQLCVVAFSDEYIQSQQYCVKFNVITSSSTCMTTTTTSTTSTTKTTSSTSTSTTTTTSTSTSTSTTTTTTSTSTTTTTTSTTSTTSTSATTVTTSTSTSTSSTSSSTSTTTTSTTTTSSSTSSTSSSTSTTTTSTTTTSSSTSSTSSSTSTTTTSSSTSSTSSSTSTTTTTFTSSSTSSTSSSTSTTTTSTTTTSSSTSSTSSSTSTTTTSTTTTSSSTSSTSSSTSTTTTSTSSSTSSTSSSTSTTTTSTTTTSSSTSSTSSSTSTTTTSTSSSTSSTSSSTSTTTTTFTSSSTSSTSSSTSTTTTSTTTTSSSTSSTSSSTSTTTTSTTSTSSSTSSTSSSTSTTTTTFTSSSTSSTSSSTSTTTTSTTSTSSSTSSASSSTSTTTTSVTTSSTTSTSMTTVTTVTVTTIKKANKPNQSINWLLLVGLSLLGLLLAVCCACACLYCFSSRRFRRRIKRSNSITNGKSPMNISGQTQTIFDQDLRNSTNTIENISMLPSQPDTSDSYLLKSSTKNLSEISRKANNHVSIKRIKTCEKPMKTENRYSSVRVQRLTGSINFNNQISIQASESTNDRFSIPNIPQQTKIDDVTKTTD